MGRLVPQGGCCIWYDEVKIFEKVEKRLGGSRIPILDQYKHLESNSKIEDFVKTIEKKDPLLAASERKLKKLMPTIQQLNQLEVSAQNQFLNIPIQFQGIFGGPGGDVAANMRKAKKKKVHRAGKKKSRGGRKKKKKSGPAKG